jgi:hypothetical protein
VDAGTQVEVDDLRWDVPFVSGIVLDADLADWDNVAYKAQTLFRPCNNGEDAPHAEPPWAPATLDDGTTLRTTCDFIAFSAIAGGTYDGIEDHSIAAALAWTPEALYLGVKVVDDVHQNPGPEAEWNGGGWNGDSVQVAFTSAVRTQSGAQNMILYNYGLHEDGSHTAHHESHPCPDESECTEATMERFEDSKLTVYEIIFPAHSLGLDQFEAGYQFGFALNVNDGDAEEEGQDGQKGFSGWAPYAIVYGREAENAGLATLMVDMGASACICITTTIRIHIRSPSSGF